ncbi:aminotransferase class I/II-fold pyridoxal phosphate-dependent enzyme [Variovorax sp. PAMC 28711]|uniref:aminotransferase class I/II-fold pyridoxal phosphate-dependent enzyme n=1 Tax=Variovorax sp. PAMC 28711 TaxID=1795631 RepID=UPI00078B85FE|nr:aminotransferase class I/II-fold pyridoxal phosphate-dependent enzyme [Variovorax sp. PAMC 28711]AMM26140.1 aminotransferase [Variovorax sp. PAMC 28711]
MSANAGQAVHGGVDASGPVPHDFSTNSNACGPCPAALAAVRAADASRYPDPQSTALRTRLASFHGVAASRIVVAASGSEFIARVTAAVAQSGGRTVAVPTHSYGDYAHAASAWQLHLIRDDGAAGTADLVWCCDPSSPLGQTPPALGARIDAWSGEGARVLDMAYAPLRLEGRPALDAGQRDRLWQLWTPNKALGLTGVRAAYAIAPANDVAAALQQRLEALAPSWPLGAHGAALLEAWVSAEVQAWLAESLVTLRVWKAAQRACLGAMPGWHLLASDANFFCARVEQPLDTLLPALRARGIKLRDCASFGLPGHVRMAVMPPASQQALADVMRRG